MNTFTLFTLVMCAVFVTVSAASDPMAPAEMTVDGQSPEAILVDDTLEGAESRGYGYNRGGHGGGRGHYGHGQYGHGHYGHGHYGHDHYHHGYGR